MQRIAQPLLRVAALGATLLAGAAVAAAPAAADAVPFSDPNAQGFLGFCDRNKHAITSGRIGAAPFAWTVVSSAPAPAGYGAGTGRATLAAYQPIKYVDPGDWSGKQMTAASKFTNSAHPMAQATAVDPALVDFTAAFPPHWDGLVQIRMIFTAPDKPQITTPYPAAVVKVSGDEWTLVSSAPANACSSGSAVSVETLALPASVVHPKVARTTPNAAPTAPGRAGTAKGNGAPGAGSTGGGSGVGNGSVAGSARAVADAESQGAAGAARGGRGWWIALAAVGAAAAASALAWRWRRRRAVR